MSDETLFYIFGIALAVSAVLLTFAGLKLKNFPGRAFPVVVLWFVALVLGATTFAVRESQHAAAHDESSQEAGGHAEEAEGQPHEEEAGGEAEEETAGGDPAAGKTVFASNCAGCHGETGEGGAGGPDLREMPLAQTEAGAVQQVTNGGGGMPPFGGQLSEEEISDVAAYVVHEVVGK